MVAENAECFIDEAQMWLNSRNFAANTINDLAVFQQSRKQGLNLYWVCQHFNRIDVAVREVTSYYNLCTPFVGGTVLVRKYTPDDMSKPVSRFIFKKGKYLYDEYWTTECIGGRDGEGYQFGALTEGGVVKLQRGTLTPNRIMFWYDWDPDRGSFAGSFSVPIEEEFKVWEQLARGFQVNNGKMFTYRRFAQIEGRIYWTDSLQDWVEREYNFWSEIETSKVGQMIAKVEDTVFKRFSI